MIWRFTLHLKNQGEITIDIANDLYAAGCDDGTPSSTGGYMEIGFDREAVTLQEAIRTAISDVRRTGLDVARVEIEEQDLAQEELAQWHTA